MNPVRRQRLIVLGFVVAGVGIAILLAILALRENINLFFTPVQVHAGEVEPGHKIHLGGMVVPGTVKKHSGGLRVTFDVTDNHATVSVVYQGLLPDLFREGSGVVALGTLDKKGLFHASEILAKHDENYMPPHIKKATKNIHSMTEKKVGIDQVLLQEQDK